MSLDFLSKKLKQARKDSQLSKSQFADELGISYMTLTTAENFPDKLTIGKLTQVANYLDLELNVQVSNRKKMKNAS